MYVCVYLCIYTYKNILMSPHHHSSILVLWGPYVVKNYLNTGTTIPQRSV